MSRILLVVIPLLSGLLAAGCSDDSERPREESTATPRPTKTTKVSFEPGKVVVLDPGTEPRRRLRLSLRAGHLETTTLTTVPTVADGKNGKPGAPVHVTVRTHVTKVAHGRITVEQEITDAHTDPGAPDEQRVTARLATLAGVTMTTVFTTRGHPVRTQMRIPRGMSREARRRIEEFCAWVTAQLTAPLPEEPVGIGARWQVASVFDQAGVTTSGADTFTLVASDKDVLTLRMLLDRKLTDGGTGVIDRGGRSGHADVAVSLTSLYPVRWESETTTAIERDGKIGVTSETTTVLTTSAE